MATAPYIFTGFKLAVAYSFIGVIGAEFITSSRGIGYEISFAYNNFDNAVMYAMILFILALVVTVGWAAVTLTINRALGTNYGYLSRKPAGGSLLDLLGEWPWYLLVVLALLAGVWALITWPWVRRSPAGP